jgi:hypothetical protein
VYGSTDTVQFDLLPAADDAARGYTNTAALAIQGCTVEGGSKISTLKDCDSWIIFRDRLFIRINVKNIIVLTLRPLNVICYTILH